MQSGWVLCLALAFGCRFPGEAMHVVHRTCGRGRGTSARHKHALFQTPTKGMAPSWALEADTARSAMPPSE